jgi:hypothetical protein
MFSRYRNLILVGFAGSILLAFPFPTAAQSKVERIKFQRGHSSTVVKGTILGFDTRDYLIGAKAGQVMTLRLSSTNPYANFVIYSINERPTDMNETTEWSEKLTESGDYLIRVLMTRAGARRKGATANYTLNVSIR